MLRIRQERESQFEFFVKFLLLFRLIRTDTQGSDIQIVQILQGITNAAGLSGAAWGVSLRVEIDEESSALEVSQADLIVVLIV